MTTYNNPCFWSRRAGYWIIDVCPWMTADGEPLGKYSGETLAQIRERYPNAELGEFDVVHAEMIKAHILPPTEITEERFMDALDVLPPVDFTQTRSATTFKLSERYMGDLTSIYARIGKRCFELRNDIHMSHDAILELVKKEFPQC